MIALSVIQPWATLIARGQKSVETRSWSTPYRGAICIHASKGFPRDCERLCWQDPFQGALIEAGIRKAEQLPRGAIVATAVLVNVLPTERFDRIFSIEMLAREWAFGDFTPGRYGLVLSSVRALAEPVPCKGKLGLWPVPAEIAALVAGQVAA